MSEAINILCDMVTISSLIRKGDRVPELTRAYARFGTVSDMGDSVIPYQRMLGTASIEGGKLSEDGPLECIRQKD